MNESKEISANNVRFISDYKRTVAGQIDRSPKESSPGSELEAQWGKTLAMVEQFLLETGLHPDRARETSTSIIAEAKNFRHFLCGKEGFGEKQIADAQFALIAMRVWSAKGSASRVR